MREIPSISHGIFIIIFPSGPIQGGLGISPMANRFKLCKLSCKTLLCIPIVLENILFSSIAGLQSIALQPNKGFIASLVKLKIFLMIQIV